eukprot:NODE_2275_length_953_cov_78.107301_g1875_i0.p2 GENE.NODE_2275_length_953_cov_78.107301_g1875_i0~~NODE_2275_length_953_cov_78.107301_g1875_i0.p2  ORF type:complete len:70 (+),score=13.97 NODE_2275_length_953_cov_78.107301_g1875_i0:734-943(+)
MMKTKKLLFLPLKITKLYLLMMQMMTSIKKRKENLKKKNNLKLNLNQFLTKKMQRKLFQIMMVLTFFNK